MASQLHGLGCQFPHSFPELSSLTLVGDYVAGFSTSIDSHVFSIACLRQLVLSYSSMYDVTYLLTHFHRPKGFNALIIDQPFYRNPRHLRELAEAVSAFFSSSDDPVDFHDLECSVHHGICIEFTLQTSTNSAANDGVKCELRLPGVRSSPNDSEEAVSTVLDCLNLKSIEMLALRGSDFPQLTEKSWQFNETLQTLVLQDIKNVLFGLGISFAFLQSSSKSRHIRN
ncbi:hypothetical protein DL96DRAFT_240981 [Flagelloscypha sp. PMI_526]|nr:hypothetical protein DL96DRAFT_240981 [Flagelloscypha sp. PMI_526]